jgi:hypothetical protein
MIYKRKFSFKKNPEIMILLKKMMHKKVFQIFYLLLKFEEKLKRQNF